MYCPVCHEEIFPDATVCRFCGAMLPGTVSDGSITTNGTNCSSCQEAVPAGSNYCPHCGVAVRTAATEPTTRLNDRSSYRSRTQPLQLPCPKCQGQMEHGFIPEYIQGRREVLVWVGGDAERSKWTNSMKVADRPMWTIRSYRCIACGYVELYASENLSSF